MNAFPTPSIDWAALTPELVLLGGAAVCMLVALFLPAAWARRFSAFAAAGCLLGAGAAAIVLFTMDDTASGVVADAIQRDRLAELAQVLICGSALLAVGVSYAYVLRERVGEYYALLLTAAALTAVRFERFADPRALTAAIRRLRRCGDSGATSSSMGR